MSLNANQIAFGAILSNMSSAWLNILAEHRKMRLLLLKVRGRLARAEHSVAAIELRNEIDKTLDEVLLR